MKVEVSKPITWKFQYLWDQYTRRSERYCFSCYQFYISLILPEAIITLMITICCDKHIKLWDQLQKPSFHNLGFVRAKKQRPEDTIWTPTWRSYLVYVASLSSLLIVIDSLTLVRIQQTQLAQYDCLSSRNVTSYPQTNHPIIRVQSTTKYCITFFGSLSTASWGKFMVLAKCREKHMLAASQGFTSEQWNSPWCHQIFMRKQLPVKRSGEEVFHSI